MIDFRYHLVSLIAVFLAVALGIVIGTTQLNGPLTDNLQDQVSGLQQDKRQLEDQTRQLQAQLDDVGSFEEAVGPTLVRDQLAGRSVVLVVADDEVPTDAVEGLSALVAAAGARATGTVRLTSGYGDPAKDDALGDYVTGTGLPDGVPAPTGDDVGEQVAALLAQVLMVPGAGSAAPAAPPASTATTSVLAGLAAIGVVDESDTSSVTAADFAVVLTSGTVSGKDADDRLAPLVQLATALDDRGSGAVVAGDSASAGEAGLVGAVRGDQAVAANVSTVDDLTAPAGQISTVLALAAEGRGTSGAYGTGDNTQPVPPPAS